MVSGNVLSDWQPVAGTDVASKKLTDNNTYKYNTLFVYIHLYIHMCGVFYIEKVFANPTVNCRVFDI